MVVWRPGIVVDEEVEGAEVEEEVVVSWRKGAAADTVAVVG